MSSITIPPTCKEYSLSLFVIPYSLISKPRLIAYWGWSIMLEEGLEPSRPTWTRDFKSLASTYSAIPATSPLCFLSLNLTAKKSTGNFAISARGKLPNPEDLTLRMCDGSYGIRTHNPLRAKQVRSHCAKNPEN